VQEVQFVQHCAYRVCNLLRMILHPYKNWSPPDGLSIAFPAPSDRATRR
jgi:hypothetical protein